MRSAVCGCCAGSRVEVCDWGGREERVWREEEGALEFGGGGDCLVECLGDSLGEEEFALRKVDEDLFEELWEGEGADRGGWFEVVGHILADNVGKAARLLDAIAFDSVVRSTALPILSIVLKQADSASQAQRHQQRGSSADRKRRAGGHDSKSVTKKRTQEEERRETNQESHVSNRFNGTLSKLPQQENPLGPRGPAKGRKEEECKRDELWISMPGGPKSRYPPGDWRWCLRAEVTLVLRAFACQRKLVGGPWG